MKETNDKNVKRGNNNLQCIYNIIDKGPVIHQWLSSYKKTKKTQKYALLRCSYGFSTEVDAQKKRKINVLTLVYKQAWKPTYIFIN